LRTEQAYVGWIRRFILASGKRHPRDIGGSEVERFLSSLAVQGRVAAMRVIARAITSGGVCFVG